MKQEDSPCSLLLEPRYSVFELSQPRWGPQEACIPAHDDVLHRDTGQTWPRISVEGLLEPLSGLAEFRTLTQGGY